MFEQQNTPLYLTVKALLSEFKWGVVVQKEWDREPGQIKVEVENDVDAVCEILQAATFAVDNFGQWDYRSRYVPLVVRPALTWKEWKKSLFHPVATTKNFSVKDDWLVLGWLENTTRLIVRSVDTNPKKHGLYYLVAWERVRFKKRNLEQPRLCKEIELGRIGPYEALSVGRVRWKQLALEEQIQTAVEPAATQLHQQHAVLEAERQTLVQFWEELREEARQAHRKRRRLFGHLYNRNKPKFPRKKGENSAPSPLLAWTERER